MEEVDSERPIKKSQILSNDVEIRAHSCPTGSPDAITTSENEGFSGFDDLYNREARFEIKLYMSDEIKKFQGVLKSRYSDFQVSEIDENGNRVELKDTSIHASLIECSSPKDNLSAEEKEYAAAVLEEALSESSVTMQDFCEGNVPKCSISTKCINSKEQRKIIHTFIRTCFGDKLGSESNNDNTIRIFTIKSMDKLWKKRDSRRSYSKREKKYLEFTLLKTNKDTITTINYIANSMHLDPKLFSIAGTKDKRAITLQKVRVMNVSPEKIIGVNTTHDIRIGDFRYVKSPLNLGSLSGNEFAIAVRDIKEISEDELERNLHLFDKNGFVNYFGLQRFGTRNIATYVIGLEILKGNWQGAFDLIMMPKDAESEQVSNAREIWRRTRDPSAALDEFPKSCVAERSLLSFMKRHKDNTPNCNTMLSTSRPLFLLYLHSYQSLVWNYVATRRLETHGKKVVIGDFVSSGNALPNDSALPENRTDSNVIEIKTWEQADMFSLKDVIIPLPGYNVHYPPSCVDFYKQFMGTHGLDPHDMKRKVKECSLPGRYRYLVSRAQGLTWSIKRYREKNQVLIPSFLDINTDSPSISSVDSEKLALILKFRLNPSEYATIALRELMRWSTLPELHKKVDTESGASISVNDV